jgi:hypothetical protein
LKRESLDMDPLIELLAASVSPGTWNVIQPDGQPLGLRGTKPEEVVGSITPFRPGLSLIVRHQAEVHDEFARRLLQLRRVMDARLANAPEQAAASAPEPPAPANPRVRKLLRELEQEIDGLIREREGGKPSTDRKNAPLQSMRREQPASRVGPDDFAFSIGSFY